MTWIVSLSTHTDPELFSGVGVGFDGVKKKDGGGGTDAPFLFGNLST